VKRTEVGLILGWFGFDLLGWFGWFAWFGWFGLVGLVLFGWSDMTDHPCILCI
tara:strand:- start:376 stop:534 length:159 start_codon:yes stop_codon:yes gene_type:complete